MALAQFLQARQPRSLGFEPGLQQTPSRKEGAGLVCQWQSLQGGHLGRRQNAAGDGAPVEIRPGLLHIHPYR
jgi:hypothetical protein